MEGVGLDHARLPRSSLFHLELADEVVGHEASIERKTPHLVADLLTRR